MDIRPIRTDDDHRAAVMDAERLFDAAQERELSSDEEDRLEVLVVLIENYEAAHLALRAGDPVDMLADFMSEHGYSRADLGRLIGSRSRATEILNRRRALTVDMIRTISREWRIPAELLIGVREPA
jgi:HTH-type transcriptional regulator/antitoxin HigA